MLVSRSTFPYFFSSRISFNSPYFPFCPALSLPKSRYRFFLQHTSPHFSTLSSRVLPFSPIFPFPLLPFVSVLPRFVPHFSSQNPVEHARSRPLLQRTSFPFYLPFPLVLSCIVDFATFVPTFVFLPSFFAGICLKNVFEILLVFFFYWFGSWLSMLWLLLWIWCINCACLHFCHILAWSLKAVICHYTIFINQLHIKSIEGIKSLNQ